MDAACTCHQAMLLCGLSSIVILDGNLISSCQSAVKHVFHTVMLFQLIIDCLLGQRTIIDIPCSIY